MKHAYKKNNEHNTYRNTATFSFVETYHRNSAQFKTANFTTKQKQGQIWISIMNIKPRISGKSYGQATVKLLKCTKLNS